MKSFKISDRFKERNKTKGSLLCMFIFRKVRLTRTVVRKRIESFRRGRVTDALSFLQNSTFGQPSIFQRIVAASSSFRNLSVSPSPESRLLSSRTNRNNHITRINEIIFESVTKRKREIRNVSGKITDNGTNGPPMLSYRTVIVTVQALGIESFVVAS